MMEDEVLNFACFELVDEINRENDRDMLITESRLLHMTNDEDIKRYTALTARLFTVEAAAVIVPVNDGAFQIISLSSDANDTCLAASIKHSIDIPTFLREESSEVMVYGDQPTKTSHAEYRFLALSAISVESVKIGFLVIADIYPRHDFGHDDRANLRDLAGSLASLISERRKVRVLKDSIK
jgi:hypothetical protein